jgi:hypothetical protein
VYDIQAYGGGGGDVSLLSFLTSALHGGEWLISRPIPVPLQKEPPALLKQVPRWVSQPMWAL